MRSNKRSEPRKIKLFQKPKKQYKLRSTSNIQTRRGCTRVIIIAFEEHKWRSIRKGTCWTPRGMLGLIKNKTFQSKPAFARTNNMELVQVFKRARKTHPITPLGKHAFNMLQKIKERCTSKHRISFTRKKCDSFTNENLNEKRENPNASLILGKHQWVGRGEGMGGRVPSFGMVLCKVHLRV